MLTAELDHLVIAAADLEQGKRYVKSKLGTEPSPGGRHAGQGTHNCLLKIGDSQYLEIIAIDPDAEEPGHPRWFNLDDPALQKSIARHPRLIGWVARTGNMKRACSAATYNPGKPVNARRGSLEWIFTFTKDGSLIEDGVLPALIEWKTSDHPSSSLPASQIDITKFEAFHPFPEVIRNHLASLRLNNVLEVNKAGALKTGLQVTFSTPRGKVTLNSSENI